MPYLCLPDRSVHFLKLVQWLCLSNPFYVLSCSHACKIISNNHAYKTLLKTKLQTSEWKLVKYAHSVRSPCALFKIRLLSTATSKQLLCSGLQGFPQRYLYDFHSYFTLHSYSKHVSIIHSLL